MLQVLRIGVLLSSTVGVTVIISLWMLKYSGEFDYYGPAVFNIHPVLAVIGTMVIPSFAILLFKYAKCNPDANVRKRVKLIHLILNLFGLVVTIFGVYYAYRSHEIKEIPHLYSLHSLVGISAIVSCSLLWLASFFSFQFPGLSGERRGKLMKYHRFMGAVMIVLYCATILLGISEKAFFAGIYASSNMLRYFVNVSGLAVVVFAIVFVEWLLEKTGPSNPVADLRTNAND